MVHGAAAGLHLMVTLPGDVDDRALAAAALRRGVKVHPLSWHGQRPQPPGLVLGYASTSPSDLDRALFTVAEARRTLTPPDDQGVRVRVDLLEGHELLDHRGTGRAEGGW
ncbi:hypothetical protein V2I01_37085 [Micromonospora sp. BRA006-A]|nr:hypothetical protein [Micromonospora sp. BRA006-A]